MNQEQLLNTQKDARNHGVATGIKLEIVKPVLWHIRYTTAPARLNKVALPLMLESKPPHMTTNILTKGSTMTKDEKELLENRVESLELQMLDMQDNLKTLGEANNCLASRHHALLECIAFMIAQPEKASNAPMLCATVVYDSITSALDGEEMPEIYKKVSREETDVFFSRVSDYKRPAQN